MWIGGALTVKGGFPILIYYLLRCSMLNRIRVGKLTLQRTNGFQLKQLSLTKMALLVLRSKGEREMNVTTILNLIPTFLTDIEDVLAFIIALRDSIKLTPGTAEHTAAVSTLNGLMAKK